MTKFEKKNIKREKRIREFCLSRDMGFSFAWNKTTDWTIEIRDIYGSIPDGKLFVQEVYRKTALKKVYSWVKKKERENDRV